MNPNRIKTTEMHDTVIFWTDSETKRIYRRVSAGVAWPHATLPGYVIILGEERYKETGYADNIVHALVEAEAQTFDELFRKCLDLSRIFHCNDFRADTSNVTANEILHGFNRRQRDQRRSPIHFRSAAFTHLSDPKTFLQYGISRISERTATGRKTLMLDGCPVLQRCLAAIPNDAAAGDKALDYPPLAALCLILSTLDSTPYSEPVPDMRQKREYNPLFWNSRQRGGYDPLNYFGRR